MYTTINESRFAASARLILDSFLEKTEFSSASRKTLRLVDYYEIRDSIDTSPVEYQRPLDPGRFNSSEKGLVRYILDLLFNRDVKSNLLPSLVLRQLSATQRAARLKVRRIGYDKILLEVTDGQHRTVCMFRLLSGDITIPEGYTVQVEGRTIDIGGMTIPQMINEGGIFRWLVETRVHTMPVQFDYYHNITDERAAEIFAERNSGTPQSRQGARNCQTHDLAVLVRRLSRNVPEHETLCHPLMACTRSSDGTLNGVYFLNKMSSSLNFDEDVAKTLATIIQYDILTKTEKMSLGQEDLDNMYKKYGYCLSERYENMLIDVLDFQHKLLSNITPKVRKDRMRKAKGMWNALRYLSVILVHRAYESNTELCFSYTKNPYWKFWTKFNKLITRMCAVSKELEEAGVRETVESRSLSKMNWYSNRTGTGLKVVFDILHKWLNKTDMAALGIVFKDKKRVYSAKDRAIAYISQNGKDAITGEYVRYEDAQMDHKLSHANGGKTQTDNGQMVSSYTNGTKSAKSTN